MESLAPEITLDPQGVETPPAAKSAPWADASTVAPEIPEIDVRPPLDDWELDEELRHIQRILAVELPGPSAAPPATGPFAPIDAAHPAPPRWGCPATAPFSGIEELPRATGGWLSALISVVLSLGLMAFAFGGVLLTWSIVTGRQDLWTIGMPTALAGQIVLLMGFILQMDRLWSANRGTAAKLDHVDQRLDDLNTTSGLLNSPPVMPTPDFYHQMAGGLNSHRMLADLKSQLDLLALKMGNKE